MIGLLCFALAIMISPFKSRLRLEAENAALRHQLMVLRRKLQGRIRITNRDRVSGAPLYDLARYCRRLAHRHRIKPPIAARGICDRSLQHSAGGSSCLAVFARFQAGRCWWIGWCPSEQLVRLGRLACRRAPSNWRSQIPERARRNRCCVSVRSRRRCLSA